MMSGFLSMHCICQLGHAFLSRLLVFGRMFRIDKWHVWRCISYVLKSKCSSKLNCGFFSEFAAISMYCGTLYIKGGRK